MVPPDDQILNQSKLYHLLAKFATNASGAILLLNLIQVTESISGSVVPLAMFVETARERGLWYYSHMTKQTCLVCISMFPSTVHLICVQLQLHWADRAMLSRDWGESINRQETGGQPSSKLLLFSAETLINGIRPIQPSAAATLVILDLGPWTGGSAIAIASWS